MNRRPDSGPRMISQFSREYRRARVRRYFDEALLRGPDSRNHGPLAKDPLPAPSAIATLHADPGMDSIEVTRHRLSRPDGPTGVAAILDTTRINDDSSDQPNALGRRTLLYACNPD